MTHQNLIESAPVLVSNGPRPSLSREHPSSLQLSVASVEIQGMMTLYIYERYGKISAA